MEPNDSLEFLGACHTPYVSRLSTVIIITTVVTVETEHRGDPSQTYERHTILKRRVETGAKNLLMKEKENNDTKEENVKRRNKTHENIQRNVAKTSFRLIFIYL